MMAADVYDEGCLHTRCCCVYDNSVYTQPSYTLWLYTLGILRNILDVVHVNETANAYRLVLFQVISMPSFASFSMLPRMCLLMHMQLCFLHKVAQGGKISIFPKFNFRYLSKCNES